MLKLISRMDEYEVEVKGWKEILFLWNSINEIKLH